MEGALAYISLSYAMSQKLPVMAIQNKEKKFVRPNLKTIQAAAQQSLKRNQAYTSSLIYTKGKNSYPISGYTYLILPKKMSNKKGVALVEFLKWALSKGQSFTESLYFISLPPSVVKSALEQLSLLELD